MKKIFSILVLLALLLPSAVFGTVYTSTQVEISMVNQIPDPAEPGDVIDLRLRVENKGSESIENFEMELLPEFPFTIYKGLAVKKINSLDVYQTGDNAYIMKYTIKVDEQASEGEANLKARYTTDGGISWITIEGFSININSYDAILDLASVKTVPKEIAPGDEIDVTFNFKNAEDTLLKDIKITLDLADTTTETRYFAPVGSVNQQVIDQLLPNQMIGVDFRLLSSVDANLDVHKIPLTVEYTDDAGTSYTKSYIFGIKVYEEPTYALAVEDTEIYKYKQNGQIIYSIANIGNSDMKFLQVELIEQEKYYTIIGTNKVYVGNLESDDFDTAEFHVNTIDTGLPEIPFKVKLTYKDDYGNLFEKEEITKIPVFSEKDAVDFGLEPAKNNQSKYIKYIVMLLLVFFWLFMVVDYFQNKMPTAKKVLWGLLLLVTFVVGAVLYYLMARKRGD